ncbi:MAG: hypothetical protein OXC54_02895, partial [Rhodospirillaceae bacterium]|nr:hypothetical protein [Rhodospirillaceae bacterium]
QVLSRGFRSADRMSTTSSVFFISQLEQEITPNKRTVNPEHPTFSARRRTICSEAIILDECRYMRRWISALAFPLFRQSNADDFFQNIMADDPSAQRIARTDPQAEQGDNPPRIR